jgi:DNA polymerase II small subunit
MSRERLSFRELVTMALREGYQLSEEAFLRLEQSPTPLDDLMKTIDSLRRRQLDVVVIEEKHVVEAVGGVDAEKTAVIAEPKMGAPIEYSVENIFNEDARIEGTVNEFSQYFHSRFLKLRRLIERRGLSFIPVSEASRLKDGDEANLVVMVMGRTETSKTVVLECDDPSGSIRLIAPKRNSDLIAVVSDLLMDQVVGVRVRRIGQSYLLQDVLHPDVEGGRTVVRYDIPETYACLISDTHVGSKKFMDDVFQSFLDWICRGRDAVAKRVRYLIIDGDLVDGIGVYPGQERELAIRDVEEQFKAAASLLADMPEHVKILYCPGNHEPVRKALPQPPIQERYRQIFGSRHDIHFATNPFKAKIGGRSFLVYHGQSLDEVIQSLPNVSYSTLERDVGHVLTTLLKARHLAPVYGENTQILPLPEDCLVIDDVPDILHTGHIHRVASLNYHGVQLVNSGAWQEQTEYQRLLGIEPSIGTSVLVELSTMRATVRFFT